jgi:hypothetical protein
VRGWGPGSDALCVCGSDLRGWVGGGSVKAMSRAQDVYWTVKPYLKNSSSSLGEIGWMEGRPCDNKLCDGMASLAVRHLCRQGSS